MKNRPLFTLACLALGPVAASAQAASPAVQRPSAAQTANYCNLPLSFEANHGQTDSQVKFLSRGNGYSLFLTEPGAVLRLGKAGKTDVIRMKLVGAAHHSPIAGTDLLPGTANYFIGKDPAKWQSDVPTYAHVQYPDIYPGIDLIYYGNHRQLEYDFVIAPAGDPTSIRLHFGGITTLALAPDGDLILSAGNGEVAFHKPVVYQEKNGQREPIAGGFTLLAGNDVGFTLGSYDHTRALVIDPTLAYSTYLGGTLGDGAQAIATDTTGNAYVTGDAQSPDFPVTSSAFQRTNSTLGRTFVTKLDPTGSVVIYSTYLGGTEAADFPSAIAVDPEGNAYLTGSAASSDFPVTPGAYQQKMKGNSNAYVTKLNPNGSALLYSTFIGGSNQDSPYAIALDSSSNAYIAGHTVSSDFPVTAGAFQTTPKNTSSAFVSKLNQAGSALVYSTFLGGTTGSGIIWGLAVDSSDHAYVAGSTYASDFPTTPGGFQLVNKGFAAGFTNAFIAKLNPVGSGLVYSTYLGGSGQGGVYAGSDDARGIAVDGAGNSYVTGNAYSKNFPITSGSFQQFKRSEASAYIAKLNPSGTALVYSTYLGGTQPTDFDSASSIAIDSKGDAFVTGVTYSPDFPVAAGAFQTSNHSALLDTGLVGNAFVTEINPTGSELIYSTYLGGTGVPTGGHQGERWGDRASGIAVDQLGNPYVAGTASSNDFPVSNAAFQRRNYAANADNNLFFDDQGKNAFVAKFAITGATSTSVSTDATPIQANTNVTFTAFVNAPGGRPTGNIRFLVDGTLGPKVALDETGHAAFSIATLPVGLHTITAGYLGAVGSYSASSAVVSEMVVGGQVLPPTFLPFAGTYSATTLVKISSATAGALIYYTTNGTVPTSSSAPYVNPVIISVNSTIRAIAVSAGDTASPIAAAAYSIIPNAVATTSALTSSPNPSLLGQAVTFTAIVTTATGAAPTGTVVFKNGNVTIGSVNLGAAGPSQSTASVTTNALTLLGHDLTATYSGSATNTASHSPVLRQIVNPQP